MIVRVAEPRRARIEIVPMIDVVFFLLVFFMMASLSMAVYGGLPVNLPRAATGQMSAAETASVTVDRDGRAFLNREPVPIAALEAPARTLLQQSPALAVVVNAYAEAAHRHVVAVLDALRLAGVSRKGIAVAPVEAAR
jgi:biopolymer transport protein ExbD